MAAIQRIQWLRRDLRRPGPQDERAQVDWHPRRPDLRFALPAARFRGSLCLRGLEREVRQGLRGGVDQSDEPRPLRPRLRSAEEESCQERGELRGSPLFVFGHESSWANEIRVECWGHGETYIFGCGGLCYGGEVFGGGGGQGAADCLRIVSGE